MTLTARAQTLVYEWVTSEVLRKHCGAVAASLVYMAAKTNQDVDMWEATGWLHDMDYERHPSLEVADNAHPFVGVRYLRENGWSEEICRAILSHADYSGVSRDSMLEKTLFAVDELSSFVVAVALVRPSKNIADVDVAEEDDLGAAGRDGRQGGGGGRRQGAGADACDDRAAVDASHACKSPVCGAD